MDTNQIAILVGTTAATTLVQEAVKWAIGRGTRSTPEEAASPSSPPPAQEGKRKGGFGVHVLFVVVGIIVGTVAADQASPQPFVFWSATPATVPPWPPVNAQWLTQEARLECRGVNYVFVSALGAQPVQWWPGPDFIEFNHPVWGYRCRINRDGTSLVLNVYNLWQPGPIGMWQ